VTTETGLQLVDFSFIYTVNPYMKLNGTVANKRGIHRDDIPGIEDVRNLKYQAPKYK
jgi:hypothetical protein